MAENKTRRATRAAIFSIFIVLVLQIFAADLLITTVGA
jgi:hypothetical protein